MSFKDLEQQLADLVSAWSAKEQAKIDAKAAKAKDKATRKAKANRPPMFKPDKPIKTKFVVTLLVRDMQHRVWGDETETSYTITETISSDEAQILAVKKANKDKLAVVEVIRTTRVTE